MDFEDEYCYHCGYYHSGETSSGGYPSEGCSDYGEINMIHLTKPQRKAVHTVFLRTCEKPTLAKYRAFRRDVGPGWGYVTLPFAGMILCIEPDGHTHS